MSHDFGYTPDLVALVHTHVLRCFREEDADMVHQHFLPDGYNCHTDGVAVVVAEDTMDVDDTSYSRDTVRISIYGPDYALVRTMGRRLWTAMTQGMTGIGLGVLRSQSTFYGAGPSFQPTGFVSTMSLSVGIAKLLTVLGDP